MRVHLMAFGVILACFSVTASAGDRFYFSNQVFLSPPALYSAPAVYGPPVVYGAPMVTYRPAYVVPGPTVTVATFPVSTVSYSTHYYAPMVPMVAPGGIVAAPMAVPRSYVSPGYVVPGVRHFRPRRYRGVEIEFERDGDIEIDYR